MPDRSSVDLTDAQRVKEACDNNCPSGDGPFNNRTEMVVTRALRDGFHRGFLAALAALPREDGQEREANAGESSQAFNEKRMDAEYVSGLIYAGEWSKVREWIERRVPVAPREDEGLRGNPEGRLTAALRIMQDTGCSPVEALVAARPAASPVASREGSG